MLCFRAHYPLHEYYRPNDIIGEPFSLEKTNRIDPAVQKLIQEGKLAINQIYQFIHTNRHSIRLMGISRRVEIGAKTIIHSLSVIA